MKRAPWKEVPQRTRPGFVVPKPLPNASAFKLFTCSRLGISSGLSSSTSSVLTLSRLRRASLTLSIGFVFCRFHPSAAPPLLQAAGHLEAQGGRPCLCIRLHIVPWDFRNARTHAEESDRSPVLQLKTSALEFVPGFLLLPPEARRRIAPGCRDPRRGFLGLATGAVLAIIRG